MIVIDASALAAYLLREEGHHVVWHALASEEVVAPGLIAWECANAVLMAERRGRVSPEHVDIALWALISLLEVNIRVVWEASLASLAYEIARSWGITVYDALYIALAREIKATLLTRDGRQAEVAENENVVVREF